MIEIISTLIAAGILAGFFYAIWLLIVARAREYQLRQRLAVSQIEIKALRGDVAELEKQLEIARRNDTPKDPVTGKFVKKT